MNERQRDLFLWLWSRRRQPGQAAVALRGALIGALGGFAFSVLMLSDMGGGGNAWPALLAGLERAGLMLVLAVPAFAFIGFVGANRVFASQEQMYQAMLNAGARVPERKPDMQPADRWPAIAVGVAVAVAVIGGFIISLFVAYW